GMVIKGYTKYKNFQDSMKNEVEVYQKKDKELRDKLQAWVSYKNPAPPAQQPPADKQAEADRNIQALKHQLEDLQADAKNTLGKKSDDAMVQMYREVRDMTQRYAAANGIEMVMHYTDNDPSDPQNYDSAANVARKMQAGACIPFYIAPGMDITKDVLQNLN